MKIGGVVESVAEKELRFHFSGEYSVLQTEWFLRVPGNDMRPDASGNTNLQAAIVSTGAIQITTTSSGTLRFPVDR